jgi:hypothetical protein
MRVELFCKCGNIAKGTIEPDEGAKRWISAWLEAHSLPGCAPCSELESLEAMDPLDRMVYLKEHDAPTE